MIKATADQQQAADADAAALAAESPAGDEEKWAAASGDEGDDDTNEKLNENVFFPLTHDIREKARQQTHNALMHRWGYTKKEK